MRDPVLEFLGLRSVKIERVPSLPFKPGIGARLGLGKPTTLAGARARLSFAPVVPAGLERPALFYDTFPPGGQLAFTSRNGRLLFTEISGKFVFQDLRKFILAGTTVERVVVDGERGVWIHGPLHQFVFEDRTGTIRTDSARLAGNTLLWRHRGLLLRLEGPRSKAEALRIARSVRAAP